MIDTNWKNKVLKALIVKGQLHHRRPGDFIRIILGGTVLLIATILARQGHVAVFEVDTFRLINHLPKDLLPIADVTMQFGSYGAVVVLTIFIFLVRKYRLSLLVFSSGTAAWLLVKILKLLVIRGRPIDIIKGVILHHEIATGAGFPSGHAAVAAATATALAPYLNSPISWLIWILAWLVALSRIFIGVHFPLDVIGGLTLGWAIGSTVHILFKTPFRQPPLTNIKKVLINSGVKPLKILYAQVDARGSIPFFAKTKTGSDLFIKTIGKQQRNADFLYKVYRFLIYKEVEDEAPFATPKQQIEHEAYLSLLASKTGVRTPPVILTAELSDGIFLLAQEKIEGKVLNSLKNAAISDKLLDQIWQEVKLLQNARIAHRDLRSANVLIDKKGQPWIIDFGFAEAAATNHRLTQDITEMLVSLSHLVGPEKAVKSATRVIGKDVLAKTLPLIQPLALSSATRNDLKTTPKLLEAVFQEVIKATGTKPTPLKPLTRIRRSTILWLLVAALAIHFLLPQIGELPKIFETIQRVDWGWLIAGAIGSVLTYVFATIGQMGTVDRTLAFGRTFLVQVASSFVNRVTPAGIGGIGINERYLEKTGLERSSAITAVTLSITVGAIIHTLALAFVVILLGRNTFSEVHFPKGWPALIAFLATALTIGLIVWLPITRRRILPLIRKGAQDLQNVTNKPSRLGELFGGSAGLTFFYIFTFAVSLQAFGVETPLVKVAAVYLGGAAIGAVSPTPSGIGTIEAALAAGLIGVGIPTAPAVAGVLTFRLLTFWLPIIPGFFTFRYLQRINLI